MLSLPLEFDMNNYITLQTGTHVLELPLSLEEEILFHYVKLFKDNPNLDGIILPSYSGVSFKSKE